MKWLSSSVSAWKLKCPSFTLLGTKPFQLGLDQLRKFYLKLITILFGFDIFDSFMECVGHVALPKQSIIIPDQFSKVLGARAYCPNTYRLCRRRQGFILWIEILTTVSSEEFARFLTVISAWNVIFYKSRGELFLSNRIWAGWMGSLESMHFLHFFITILHRI